MDENSLYKNGVHVQRPFEWVITQLNFTYEVFSNPPPSHEVPRFTEYNIICLEFEMEFGFGIFSKSVQLQYIAHGWSVSICKDL